MAEFDLAAAKAKIKQVTFYDEIDQEEAPQQPAGVEPAKVQFMKRYFSNMCDMYPEDAMKFILLREKAKRVKHDAAVAVEKLQNEMDTLFAMKLDERLVNTDVLGSPPESYQSSPEKINLN